MRSEAQKRADKKYRESGKDKYGNIGATMHINNIEIIKKIALAGGLTPSKYAARAIFYCANNNIDLSQYDEKLHDPDNPDKPKNRKDPEP